MTDTTPFGFGKLVPGFDFLQNLASSAVKGAQQGLPNMPSLSSWVAPTLSVEEIDKRITELKAVQFWLDQNARALAATIQALEVQKMTLATLKGMNFSMGDVAKAFQVKTADMMSEMQKASANLAAAATAATTASAPPRTGPRPRARAGARACTVPRA
ncbi:PhaM family polyhydroxyalkanoate granule multifunctional regulatory protein [Curvibacter lanceolatus]|uniref:PhaM family polyhydroxyalkanoate granule multifunctional regulatory protein n=1 Tax=Curvibacter lanceolatus TaxID=86182 RepID=UPI0003A1034F|nr:PhaM family polyhydroxyalkanoate granule multifunctional regulatory protein [Curvibacter lanceolatus]